VVHLLAMKGLNGCACVASHRIHLCCWVQRMLQLPSIRQTQHQGEIDLPCLCQSVLQGNLKSYELDSVHLYELKGIPGPVGSCVLETIRLGWSLKEIDLPQVQAKEMCPSTFSSSTGPPSLSSASASTPQISAWWGLEISKTFLPGICPAGSMPRATKLLCMAASLSRHWLMFSICPSAWYLLECHHSFFTAVMWQDSVIDEHSPPGALKSSIWWQ